MNACTAIVGINWGDEGKGRMVDLLTESFDVVIRYQGGANAGHTVINQFGEFEIHALPSGVFRKGVVNVIGNGVALDPEKLLDEIRSIQEKGVSITGVDCSTLKPLDEEMLRTCCSRNIPLFAVEEEQEIGGFGSELLRICSQEHLQPLTRVIGLPDRFIGHGDMTSLYRELGLLPQQLAERLLTMIKETDGNKHA